MKLKQMNRQRKKKKQRFTDAQVCRLMRLDYADCFLVRFARRLHCRISSSFHLLDLGNECQRKVNRKLALWVLFLVIQWGQLRNHRQPRKKFTGKTRDNRIGIWFFYCLINFLFSFTFSFRFRIN